VDQRDRLQGVAGTLRSHSLNGNGAQFRINLLIKLVQGMGIAASSIPEEPGYSAHGSGRCNNRFTTKTHVKTLILQERGLRRFATEVGWHGNAVSQQTS
jgi:hypothetical protein